MALYKEITDEKGIVTTYHRIEQVKIYSNGKVRMRTLSYTSEEKRLEEKNAYDFTKEAELLSLIENLENTTWSDKTEEDIEGINREIEMYKADLEALRYADIPIDTSVSEKWFEFTGIDITQTFNYTDAYNLLKELEVFQGSEDIIEE